MDNITNGNFSDELLENVKKIYLSSLKSIEDYQDDLIGNFISEIYLNDDDLSIRRKKIEKVSKKDLIEFAKKVHMDTIYLLKGEDYEDGVWVDRWMPFDGGIGLHDASWRSDFGGDAYLNGSHGCVNMRFEDADYVFDRVDVGTNVLVHK